MSLVEFDLIRVMLETSLLGSTTLLIGMALLVPGLMLVIGRIPPFLTFIILSPAFIAFSTAPNLIPGWVSATVWIVLALFWVFVTRLVLQQQ